MKSQKKKRKRRVYAHVSVCVCKIQFLGRRRFWWAGRRLGRGRCLAASTASVWGEGTPKGPHSQVRETLAAAVG